MPITVLFDLDDTLLHTNIDQFLPEYFQALSRAFANLTSKKQLTQQIQHAVQQMTANQSPERMLKQIFNENFYEPLGTTETACQDTIRSYYRDVYPNFKAITQLKPEALSLIRWCQSQQMTVAILTNPLFPETAIRQRIEWAGLDPDAFAFYSHFENFHFTKPNLTYYAEAMGKLGWPDGHVVMVGDNLSHDILPMNSMGYKTFWINSDGTEIDQPHGPLSDVKSWLEKIDEKNDHGLSETPEVLLAILRATPAVIDGWLKEIPDSILREKPSQQEWNIVEVLWHMADMEKEVYLPQWKQLQANPKFNISPINTSAWAESRSYQTCDPETALRTFLQARIESLALIDTLRERDLFEVSNPNPIFGNTKIRELVSFSVKHDRLHLKQCVNLLNFYKIY